MNKYLLKTFICAAVLCRTCELYADSWLGVANSSSDDLRFAAMTIDIGDDSRDLLLRSLPANSDRIWFRILGDKPIGVSGIAWLGSFGIQRTVERPKKILPAGVYQLDINKSGELVILPGPFNAEAEQVPPLWDLKILALCDRLEPLKHPDVERENERLNELIRAYKPVKIPGKYTVSPALMSLFSIGYEHGWYSTVIPELEFERVDYFFIEPAMPSISNKNEILPFHNFREIFKEAFKSGWDDAKKWNSR